MLIELARDAMMYPTNANPELPTKYHRRPNISDKRPATAKVTHCETVMAFRTHRKLLLGPMSALIKAIEVATITYAQKPAVYPMTNDCYRDVKRAESQRFFSEDAPSRIPKPLGLRNIPEVDH